MKGETRDLESRMEMAERSLVRIEAAVREEGRLLRQAIFKAVMFLIFGAALIAFAPFLIAAAPVIFVILGICLAAAVGGSAIGKGLTRRRERAIYGELRARGVESSKLPSVGSNR